MEDEGGNEMTEEQSLERQQLKPKLESLRTQLNQLSQLRRKLESPLETQLNRMFGPEETPETQLRLKLQSPDDMYDAWWLEFDGITYRVLDGGHCGIYAAIPPKDIATVNDALRSDLSNFEEVMKPYLVAHKAIEQAEAERKLSERSNVTMGLEAVLALRQMHEEAVANPSPTDFKVAEKAHANDLHIIALRKRLEAYEAEDAYEVAYAEMVKAITV